MLITRLFVYGSLSQGMVHFNRIKDFVVTSTPGFVNARVYRLQVGFPALVWGDGVSVRGQIIELKPLDLLTSLLDEFHGYSALDEESSLFHRRPIAVTESLDFSTLEGSVVEEPLFAYFLNPSKLTAEAVEIKDGDWLRSMKEVPPMTTQLSARQKSYISKLGHVTGRGGVPIDMVLYRELMKLGLIVDKGRRLALSKFGYEVFKYLE